MTMPAVSVRSTLSPKRANMKPFSFIFIRSFSLHPPSGQTQMLIASFFGISCIFMVIPVVSSTIFDIFCCSWEACSNTGSCTLCHQVLKISSINSISGIMSPPHCSSASRAIVMSRIFFVSESMSFCDLSDRKKTNF